MKARRQKPRPPRLPPEPIVEALTALEGEDELVLEGVRIEADSDSEAVAAASVEIEESDLTGVSFDGGALRQLLIRDSILRTCDLSNVGTRRGGLRRAELRQSRLVGLALTEAQLEDVRIVGGTMMLAAFGASRLTRVVFDEVNLRETSFADAQLQAVVFLGCDLTGTDFRGARLTNCLISGSTLEGVTGIESLRGVAMPWPDLVASTGALAAALGIAVEED